MRRRGARVALRSCTCALAATMHRPLSPRTVRMRGRAWTGPVADRLEGRCCCCTRRSGGQQRAHAISPGGPGVLLTVTGARGCAATSPSVRPRGGDGRGQIWPPCLMDGGWAGDGGGGRPGRLAAVRPSSAARDGDCKVLSKVQPWGAVVSKAGGGCSFRRWLLGPAGRRGWPGGRSTIGIDVHRTCWQAARWLAARPRTAKRLPRASIATLRCPPPTPTPPPTPAPTGARTYVCFSVGHHRRQAANASAKWLLSGFLMDPTLPGQSHARNRSRRPPSHQPSAP
ncbi:hypothetical protein BDV95DRAFT_380512 [Massariosphaeria phaeospora]|uniref:Uncharacterized protein n=1 Tax=Massariosphaeria phaeospora TaxID=100035 RepID=A0A7C8MD05_9PLEO|nr:hypothetical protein BDV95DRAFT_380512 [Massariosphaeria phaeospora]